MSGSRRFLLILVLASVSCFVLVQVTLDGWHFGSTFTYGDDQKRELENNALEEISIKNSTKEIPKVSVIKIATSLSTHSPLNVTSSIKVKPTMSSTKPPALKTTIRNAQAKGQVRRLPLAKRPSKYDMKQFVNRQDRIQEILKQSKVTRNSIIDPMKTLKSMAAVNPNNVTRILVITYFRAGSSFFGDILQQNWKTFYNFEPLHSMTYNSRIGDDKVGKVFDLFNGVFRCNFTELKNYMEWVKKPNNQFLFAHNLFLWVTCHNNPKTCFNPMFDSAVCQRAPIHVMKVTRLHMRHLRRFLHENPDLKIKVVYLTRDPRAIISSRSALDWCNGTECSDPVVLCHEMSEDTKIFQHLQQKEPQNFINVRYEDLAQNPYNETEKIFKFLKLPFSKSVKKFLKTHTVARRADINNPYSTRRNSTAMVFRWREKVTYNEVLNIQSSCAEALNYLNHTLIVSSSELPHPNGTVKVKHRSTNSIQTLSTKTNLPSNRNKSEKIDNHISLTQPVIQQSKSSISNNTNIQIHKTYKLLNTYQNKLLNGTNHFPVKNKIIYKS